MDDDQSQRAVVKAYRLLTYGARSRRGLCDKLRQAGFDEITTNAAVARMEYEGYIDDAKYAADFIAYAAETKLQGRRRIVHELRQKGVDRETAENAAEEYFSGEDDSETRSAVKLIEGWLRKEGTEAVDLDADDKRRLSAYMARRGFSYSVLGAALEIIKEAE